MLGQRREKRTAFRQLPFFRHKICQTNPLPHYHLLLHHPVAPLLENDFAIMDAWGVTVFPGTEASDAPQIAEALHRR